MKRVYLTFTGIGLLGVLAVGVVIVLRPPPIMDFEWAVQEGATFQYRVRAWGSTLGGEMSESLEADILSLDGTYLWANVVSLPSVKGAFNATSFGLNVISVPKVTCTLTNGTDLEADLEEILVSSISGCFLPIGGWSGIDSFYPEDLPYWGAYGTSYLTSELFDDYLQIGYAWFGMVDSSGGWSGNVSLADGVPSEVLWHYTHQYPSIYIGFSLLPHPS